MAKTDWKKKYEQEKLSSELWAESWDDIHNEMIMFMTAFSKAAHHLTITQLAEVFEEAKRGVNNE